MLGAGGDFLEVAARASACRACVFRVRARGCGPWGGGGVGNGVARGPQEGGPPPPPPRAAAAAPCCPSQQPIRCQRLR
eukprot:2184833-Alexandrium_andersonii.AAC.1